MDIRRGSAPVVSARGTTARKLHEPAKTGGTHMLDLRASKAVPGHDASSKTVSAPAPAPKPETEPIILTKASPRLSGRPHDHAAASIASRLERAKAVAKSQQVSRFGSDMLSVVEISPPTQPEATPIPEAAVTAHATLASLVPTPESPRRHTAPKWTQYAGVAAAIAVMAGYIWLENYPKLTIQAAAAKAGVAATNPSYLPTSYALAGTNAQPGLLTLSFKSPSETTPLTIAQERTSWDTQSLVDNYVAKADSAYSSVQSQGLTIYLFDQNQAAWVNHGIMYSIKGTARLSRNQVLQIAYGL